MNARVVCCIFAVCAPKFGAIVAIAYFSLPAIAALQTINKENGLIYLGTVSQVPDILRLMINVSLADGNAETGEKNKFSIFIGLREYPIDDN